MTVVTIGSPSGIAATARETEGRKRRVESAFSFFEGRAQRKLTSNGEHLQPTPFLDDSNENNDSDDGKRDDGELLGQFVHRDLEGSSLLFNLAKKNEKRSAFRSDEVLERRKTRLRTSCIIEKITPNSVLVPVPTTIPDP